MLRGNSITTSTSIRRPLVPGSRKVRVNRSTMLLVSDGEVTTRLSRRAIGLIYRNRSTELVSVYHDLGFGHDVGINFSNQKSMKNVNYYTFIFYG